MPWENGVNWEPIDPEKRGQHATFSAAVSAALSSLTKSSEDDFLQTVVDEWPRLFPAIPAKPGRFANGILFLYVHSSTQVFSLRSRLPFIRRNLLALPGAPKKLTLRLEAHTETL
jgi:hypothetical protein